MKKLMLSISAALAVAFSSAALAAGPGSAALSWVLPTTAVDGTALAPLSSVVLYRGRKADGTDLAKLATLAPPLSTYADAGLDYGQWCYAVTAVNAAGESDKSAVACKTVADGRPAVITITVR